VETKLNVTLTLNPPGAGAFTNLTNSHTGYDVETQTILHTDALKILHMLCIPGDLNNCANFNDANFTTQYNKAAATVNTTDRNAILKQLCTQLIDTAAYIPIGATDFNTYWWPWVKNYYGEYDTGAYQPGFIGKLNCGLTLQQKQRRAISHCKRISCNY